MKKRLYRRKPGEFEIRILRNGRVVFVSPDETLMDVAEALDERNPAVATRREAKNHARAE